MSDPRVLPMCPACNDPRDSSVERVERSKKMRLLLPGSKKFVCDVAGISSSSLG